MDLATTINIMGTLLSLLGLGVVAPKAVRLVLTQGRSKLGWPKRPPGRFQIFGIRGYGIPRIDWPDPALPVDQRVTKLEAIVKGLNQTVTERVQDLDQQITRVENQTNQALADIEREDSQINAVGFLPVAVGMICSGSSDLLSRTTAVGWVVAVGAIGMLVYFTGWLICWIKKDRGR